MALNRFSLPMTLNRFSLSMTLNRFSLPMALNRFSLPMALNEHLRGTYPQHRVCASFDDVIILLII